MADKTLLRGFIVAFIALGGIGTTGYSGILSGTTVGLDVKDPRTGELEPVDSVTIRVFEVDRNGRDVGLVRLNAIDDQGNQGPDQSLIISNKLGKFHFRFNDVPRVRLKFTKPNRNELGVFLPSLPVINPDSRSRLTGGALSGYQTIENLVVVVPQEVKAAPYPDGCNSRPHWCVPRKQRCYYSNTQAHQLINIGDTVYAKRSTKLKRGREIVASVAPNLRFQVMAVKDNWIWTSAIVRGEEVRGWIYRSHVGTGTPPAPSERRVAARK